MLCPYRCERQKVCCKTQTLFVLKVIQFNNVLPLRCANPRYDNLSISSKHVSYQLDHVHSFKENTYIMIDTFTVKVRNDVISLQAATKFSCISHIDLVFIKRDAKGLHSDGNQLI